MRFEITKHYDVKDSSIISHVTYDTMSNTLLVDFHDKGKSTGKYRYDDVSPDVVYAWRVSKSIGSFFIEHIKDVYKCTKVG